MAIFEGNDNPELGCFPGVSTKRSAALARQKLRNVADLLMLLPRKYLDRRNISAIATATPEEEASFLGRVENVEIRKTRRGKQLEVLVYDGTATLNCVWFRGFYWMPKVIKRGVHVAISGKVKFYRGLQIPHPEIEVLQENENPQITGKILPVYAGHAELKQVGCDNRFFRKLLKNVFARVEIGDYFPANFRQSQNLPALAMVIPELHQPDSDENRLNAFHRLKFDAHFFLQILLILKHIKKQQAGRSRKCDSSITKDVYNSLPFQLTDAQLRVLREIRHDLESPRRMNRLLQGDVGSGKTVVAALAAAMVAGIGEQVAIMAPTELLANQHNNNFRAMFEGSGLSLALLTASNSTKENREIRQQLKDGQLNIVIGTHALFQEKVKFDNLGLTIIDEQHRFGVAQRAKLLAKGQQCDYLAMTATPIPRTLMHTLNGDMDISVIDELPRGRKASKTRVIAPQHLDGFKSFIRKECQNGRQVYVVYPLIQESEFLDLETAESGYEQFAKDFPEFSVEFIHGQMNKGEQDTVSQAFQNGDVQILVATTVVEVGIDVPNATVMMVENAERFGLSQLHQLRGRIGRGTEESWCFLMNRGESKLSQQRLFILQNEQDGFRISDQDLKLRGPGNMLGTEQHGYLNDPFIDLQNDDELIRRTRVLAEEMLQKDPHLRATENIDIRREFLRRHGGSLEFVDIA